MKLRWGIDNMRGTWEVRIEYNLNHKVDENLDMYYVVKVKAFSIDHAMDLAKHETISIREACNMKVTKAELLYNDDEE